MIICVADLKPGMTLASDVAGVNGRLLLPSGTVLEEQHLRVFNIWGVSEADIKEAAADDNDPDQDEAAVLEVAQAHADVIFTYTDMAVEPMPFIKEASIRFYATILADQGELPLPPQPFLEVVEPPASPRFASTAQFLEGDAELASFPDIYYRIMEALDDPLSTANNLADIISKDPGICARLLSLVNSPLYGFSKPIASLSHAVSMVGTRSLSQLALGVTVMDRFQSIDDALFTMNDFWKRSLACAAIDRIIASQIPGISQDLCFVAGMLHDVGRLIMLQNAPDDEKLCHRLSKANGILLSEAEKIVFGFSHRELAERLFKTWHFPDDLTEAATHQHGFGGDSPRVEAAICEVSDALAVAMQYGSNGNEYVHTICPEAWAALDIPQSALATTMVKAKRQINDLFTIFMG